MEEVKLTKRKLNISLITLEEKIKPFGSITFDLECPCGTQNEPLLVYKGQFEIQNYNCTGCGKGYKIGSSAEIHPKIKLS